MLDGAQLSRLAGHPVAGRQQAGVQTVRLWPPHSTLCLQVGHTRRHIQAVHHTAVHRAAVQHTVAHRAAVRHAAAVRHVVAVHPHSPCLGVVQQRAAAAHHVGHSPCRAVEHRTLAVGRVHTLAAALRIRAVGRSPKVGHIRAAGRSRVVDRTQAAAHNRAAAHTRVVDHSQVAVRRTPVAGHTPVAVVPVEHHNQDLRGCVGAWVRARVGACVQHWAGPGPLHRQSII